MHHIHWHQRNRRRWRPTCQDSTDCYCYFWIGSIRLFVLKILLKFPNINLTHSYKPRRMFLFDWRPRMFRCSSFVRRRWCSRNCWHHSRLHSHSSLPQLFPKKSDDVLYKTKGAKCLFSGTSRVVVDVWLLL